MNDNTFLASLQQEGRIDQPVREEKEEKETPPAPPAENNRSEDEPKSQPGKDEPKGEGEPDGKKPKEGEEPAIFQAFHKHPRWMALQEELKNKDVTIQELIKFKEQVEPL